MYRMMNMTVFDQFILIIINLVISIMEIQLYYILDSQDFMFTGANNYNLKHTI